MKRYPDQCEQIFSKTSSNFGYRSSLHCAAILGYNFFDRSHARLQRTPSDWSSRLHIALADPIPTFFSFSALTAFLGRDDPSNLVCPTQPSILYCLCTSFDTRPRPQSVRDGSSSLRVQSIFATISFVLQLSTSIYIPRHSTRSARLCKLARLCKVGARFPAMAPRRPTTKRDPRRGQPSRS